MMIVIEGPDSWGGMPLVGEHRGWPRGGKEGTAAIPGELQAGAVYRHNPKGDRLDIGDRWLRVFGSMAWKKGVTRAGAYLQGMKMQGYN